MSPQQPISQQQKVSPQLPISQERNMSQQNAPAEYAQQITQQQNMAPQHLDIQTVGSVSQQLINNLSDSEVELLERLKSWVESVWNIDNGNIKAKIKRLIQAYSSKLFMEICKESKQSIDLRGIENTQFEHAFNVLTTISNQRKQLTDVQISNKLIGNSPPLTVTLEENLFPGYKIELANAALAAFQFFFSNCKNVTPAMKLSTFKLFNTGVGVSTYLKKTDFSFQMNGTSVRGKQAENFLIRTFPHFRQTIIASEHSLAQIHSVFKHITLCIKEISGEDFKIEEAHTFQNFISNEIRLNRTIQNDFILPLKKIISIEEFFQKYLI